ncbi:MAG: hypothetical protein MI974_27635 [Chitinophagales bacterium]|nr:hypothetical protein [Chitinophagales bacterium]
MDEAYEKILTLVENNKLQEAIDALLDISQQYASKQESAVRLLRSSLNELEQESLIFGNSSSIRDRKTSIKLRILNIATAIKEEASTATSSIDTSILVELFKKEDIIIVRQSLLELIDKEHPKVNDLLVLEQDWKKWEHDQRNNLATAEILSVRYSQLTARTLELINNL